MFEPVPYIKSGPLNNMMSRVFEVFLEKHDQILIYDTAAANPKHYRVKNWKIGPLPATRGNISEVGVTVSAEYARPNGRQYIISTLLTEIECESDNDFSSGKPLKLSDELVLALKSMNTPDMDTYIFKFQLRCESREYA